MLKKISIIFVLVFALLFNVSLAKAQETLLVSVEELGVENVGRLPTSPLYFLKEIRRGIKKFFAFNRVKKAEIELEISNEKVAEIIALEEKEPMNIEAIKEALANYSEAKEKLAERIKLLETESNNPNVEKLLGKVEEQANKHIEVFGRLEEKFEEDTDVKEAIDELESGLEDLDLDEEDQDAAEETKSAPRSIQGAKPSFEKDLDELELSDIDRDLGGLNDY